MQINIQSVVAAFAPELKTPAATSGFRALLEFIAADSKIEDPRWAAYMLATVRWECAGKWQPIEEYGKGAGRPYGAPATVRDADGTEYSNVYYGRGYVQLTWKANYSRMSQALYLGSLLVLHPEHALEPQTAYNIMSLGMRLGMFTGVGLGRFIHDDSCDYLNARKIINGLDQAEKIAEFAKGFEGLLKST